MTQESLSREAREQRASETLAAQLEALARPLADRVLGRAIELDHEAREAAEAAADTIDYETLRDIAAEVGISEASLEKALLEELNTERDHNARPIERATIPDTVRGGLVVPGTAEEVAARLRRHLERVGLVEDGQAGHRTTWRQPSGRRTVETWTVPQRDGRRQLVEVDIETRPARSNAWRWVVGIMILAMLSGSAFGSVVLLGVLVAGVATVVGFLRRVGRMARRTINRALGEVAQPLGNAIDQIADDWLELFERLQKR